MIYMKAGKVIILVGVVGALGFGAWWYFKKRKKATTSTPGAGTTLGTGSPTTPVTTTPGTTPPATIAPGEPIPKMQNLGNITSTGISPEAAAICNVPAEILNEKNVFVRVGKRVAWESKIAYPSWEAQGRGMDLNTYMQQLKEEGGCAIK
jgi:hypothetical protein